MRNGILKSMGVGDIPVATEYEIGYGFKVVFEPNADTLFRLRNEQAARQAAGDTGPVDIHLTDAELDCVVHEVWLAKRAGNVLLAGGLVPQAAVLGKEISRMPKVELMARVDQAFANAKG